jgi:pSer/pThr/pTyr-binding forkhead associated (FHA) protein
VALVFVEEQPVTGRVVAAAEHTIGREGCDVLLPDPEVSRRHARVLIEAGVPQVEDLGSSNGTYVNGRRIDRRTELRAGDRVEFGNTLWVLRDAADETRIRDRAR